MTVTTSTLPAPSYRTVTVGGVEVELFEDTKPSRIAPMKVALGYWAECSDDFTAEEITRLHLAGIEALPVYETELLAAGIKFEELDGK